jgi:hypothetical protein
MHSKNGEGARVLSSIATSLQTEQSLTPCLIPDRRFHNAQIGFAAHTTFYVMGTRGLFFWNYSNRGAKLTTQLHIVLKIRMVELYLHSPISLHGMVLN